MLVLQQWVVLIGAGFGFRERAGLGCTTISISESFGVVDCSVFSACRLFSFGALWFLLLWVGVGIFWCFSGEDSEFGDTGDFP